MKAFKNILLVGLAILAMSPLYGQSNGWITNPIIPGFNPDPAILRVDDDYFIATSSFEWFPGVPLYHSKDLKNWELIGHALTRKSQANLRGIPASGGVYAPSLHYHKGKYYLIYTVVQTSEGWPMTATPNYLIHTDDIFSGKWSEPVYLNSVGFDPSLFFEDDKTYALSMVMDFRLKEPTMGKISLQEIDLETGKPLGEMKIIFDTRNMWGTEGPHIYKKDGYYYLLVAQGGTFYEHTASLARSKNLWGLYELAPNTPFMTSANDSSLRLQRAGHGSLVDTQDGEWYMAHLASRSLMPDRKSPLGRESCLQKVEWTSDGWLKLTHGSIAPADSIAAPNLPSQPVKVLTEKDEFEEEKLRIDYQYLREMPDSSWLKLERGKLKIRGRRPPTSRYDLSLVARRLTSYETVAETELTFDADSYRHKAGISAYYDHRHFYFLAVTHNDSLGRCVELLGFENGKYKEYEKANIFSNTSNKVKLRFTINGSDVQFAFQEEGNDWKDIGKPLYYGNLADEQNGRSGFTGSMAILVVMDVLHEDKWASFEYFNIKTADEKW